MIQIQPLRARFEKIIAKGEQSFFWHHVICRQFGSTYHYHPECEINHIRRGRGRRLVADSIGEFEPNDLVFIPPNVPHVWQIAPECPQAESIYIQFAPDFLGKDFFERPEMRMIRERMMASRGGVTFSRAVRDDIAKRLKDFPQGDSTERLLYLLDVLHRLSRDPATRPLGNMNSGMHLNRGHEAQINEAFAYLNQNLKGPIRQSEIAQKVRLSSSAFSRLFKRTTGKRFMTVVNDLRVAQVCRQLGETNMTISEIAFASGFETLSHFNCQFRRVMKTTPNQYRHNVQAVKSQDKCPNKQPGSSGSSFATANLL